VVSDANEKSPSPRRAPTNKRAGENEISLQQRGLLKESSPICGDRKCTLKDVGGRRTQTVFFTIQRKALFREKEARSEDKLTRPESQPRKEMKLERPTTF